MRRLIWMMLLLLLLLLRRRRRRWRRRLWWRRLRLALFLRMLALRVVLMHEALHRITNLQLAHPPVHRLLLLSRRNLPLCPPGAAKLTLVRDTSRSPSYTL